MVSRLGVEDLHGSHYDTMGECARVHTRASIAGCRHGPCAARLGGFDLYSLWHYGRTGSLWLVLEDSGHCFEL